MRAAFVLPPAQTSNEIDMIRSMDDWDVTVIGEVGDRHGCDVELRSRRVPVVGDPSHWTAAIAWLRDLDEVELPPIDLVLSIELFSIGSIQAASVARRFDVPHMVICYEVVHRDPMLWLAPPYGIWAHRMLRRADGFLCQSALNEEVLRTRGAPPDRLFTVPSGVDTELFRPAPQRATQPVATFVGELRPDKGILDTIKACDLAAPRIGPDFQLVVVGDGDLRSEVEGLASTRPWLEIKGKLPRDEVAETLRRSAAFIVAPYSRLLWSEQLGFASIEAMSCGLPVVATLSGAVGTVVPAYNPLCAEHDVEALARGIEAAVGPDGDRWGRDNRNYVLEHFSLQGQAEAASHALTQLVGMPRRRAARPARSGQR